MSFAAKFTDFESGTHATYPDQAAEAEAAWFCAEALSSISEGEGEGEGEGIDLMFMPI